MLTREGAQALAEYKTWADGLTLAAVAGLPPGEAARERATPHKSLIGTLNHMYVVDLIWEAHLGGRAHGLRRATSSSTPRSERSLPHRPAPTSG